MNLTLEQQRKIIIWLSGVYGLLIGIILLFFLDVRMGIETWLQLAVILLCIVGIVLLCDYLARRIVMYYQNHPGMGRRFWMMFISILPALLLTVFLLAFR
jgi:hypothetical protein